MGLTGREESEIAASRPYVGVTPLSFGHARR